MDEKLKAVLIDGKRSILDAMSQLEESSRKALFVTRPTGEFIGTVVDGDIRRWILAGGGLDGAVEDVCNREPVVAHEPYDRTELKETMIRERITAVPVIDANGRIGDVLFWESLITGTGEEPPPRQIDLPVVVMAGGMGTRLDPFTKILPKPLIPVGEHTALEVVINSFVRHGVDRFYVSLFHKAGIIRAYLQELAPDYTIDYVIEEKPLGTAGALQYLNGKLGDSFVLTNCDNVIRADYADLVDHHRSSGNLITIVTCTKTYRIPYGVCEIRNGGTLESMVEKPEYRFLVNTGMYVIQSEVLDLIPADTMFHVTQLIDVVRGGGGRVGVYPIGEHSWLDVGEWAEYKNTLKKLEGVVAGL
jgi:dTDP-glucose pyrophosphorylase